MTAATEREVQAFQKEFGFKADSDFACFHNALGALMFVHEKTGEIPRIYKVAFPGDHHAYIVYHGVVYNEGVTWPDHRYRDYSFSELEGAGEDVTLQTLEAALAAYEGGPDPGGFLVAGRLIAENLRTFKKAKRQMKEKGIPLTRFEYYGFLLRLADMKERGLSKEEIREFFLGE